MKKLFLVIVFLSFPLLCSCQQNLPYGNVERDYLQIGGNLSFSYDAFNHTATFGGEGEVVQFYQINQAKGWREEGCRIGIRISPPSSVENYEGISVFVDGKENPPFLQFIYLNGEKTGEIELFPLITSQNQQIEIKVDWQSNVNSQTYIIRLADGTVLMQKQST